MLLSTTIVLATLLNQAVAQVTLTGTNQVTSTGEDYPTSGVTYASDGNTITITRTGSGYTRPTDLSSAVSYISDDSNSTTRASNATTTSASQTYLVGGTYSINGTSIGNFTASATTTSARPTNTVPCNGYREFCSRKYSNITYVAAHNSPFIRPGNAASNQELEVLTQLNDGVRMLQFQTHDLNGTLYLCHTSCEILNVGPLENYLRTVVEWMDRNPYDVVTILMGNDDVLPPERYIEPVINSGLINYAYTAPTVPMPLDRWPTLGEMILTNQRAVVMLDYEANQQAIPWLLDEFSQMWETPFSPTDRDFPCTAQRPPDRPRDIRLDRMYMANHNLNVQIALAGISLDVPAYTILNETNAVSGYGSAGRAVENCTTMWNRPPNFILVDYYNLGNFNGSVFQVAAEANNVGYDRDSCCGTNQRDFSSTGVVQKPVSWVALMLAVGVGIGML
jgi:hypothetical protein